MYGVNAISPTGRALEAATENMTPDQQAQYIQQQQQSGVPLNPQLALMMIQLNKLKQAQTQQQAGPPPQTTVAQDLNNATQASGVASLPVAPDMYGPKSMAGGGIVAFAGGGGSGLWDWSDVGPDSPNRPSIGPSPKPGTPIGPYQAPPAPNTYVPKPGEFIDDLGNVVGNERNVIEGMKASTVVDDIGNVWQKTHTGDWINANGRAATPVEKAGIFSKLRSMGNRSYGPTTGEVVQGVKSLGTKAGLKTAGSKLLGGIAGAVPAYVATENVLATPKLWNADVRDVRSSLGMNPEGSYLGDVAARTAAYGQELVPFYEGITGRKRALEEAGRADETKIKIKASPDEIKFAQAYQAALDAGDPDAAEKIAGQYRTRFKKNKEAPSADIDAYLASLAASTKGVGGESELSFAGIPLSQADRVYGEALAAAKAKVAGNPKVDEEAEIKKQEARMRAAGIGAADEKQQAKNAEQIANLPKEQRRDAWLTAANAFFKMAEASGRTSSFMGAAAEGAVQGISDYKDVLKEYKATSERLNDKAAEIQRHQEILKSQNIQAGTAEARRLEAKYDADVKDLQDLGIRKGELETNIQLQNMKSQVDIAVANLARAGRSKEAEQLQAMYAKASMSSAPEAKAAADRILIILQNLAQTNPGYMGAVVRANAANPYGNQIPPTAGAGDDVISAADKIIRGGDY